MEKDSLLKFQVHDTINIISITGNIHSTLYEDVVYNHDGRVVIGSHNIPTCEGT